MRWEDERYVRVYTRDTPEWCLLSWEARALFLFLLRAVDRAGILPVGKSGARSVAAMLRMPLDITERALTELLDDGCARLSPDGQALVIPNFTAAQEAKQSDKARQKAARERARAKAAGEEPGREDSSRGVTAESQGVTDPSHGVTGGHTESHDVTLSCAVPSRADPPVVPPPGEAGQPGAKPKGQRAKPKTEMPAGWTPKDAHRAKCHEHGFDVAAEGTRFANHHGSKGNVFANWDMAFHTWIDNEIRWKADRGGKAVQPQHDDRPASVKAEEARQRRLREEAQRVPSMPMFDGIGRGGT